jgi:glucose/arabinose dehydrogenase
LAQLRCIALSLLACCISSPALAAFNMLPAVTRGPGNLTVSLQKVADVSAPITDIVPANDGTGRTFVTQIGGDIRVVTAAGSLLSTPYLSTGNASSFSSGDAQFTTMVVHPDFATNRLFYTVEPEQNGTGTATFVPQFGTGNTHMDVLYEYTVSQSTSNVASIVQRREVMRFQQTGVSHNVDDLAFDANKLLYISLGDGENSTAERANSPSLNSAFGKVLRINPLNPNGVAPAGQAISANGKYSIPNNNPFVDGAGAKVDEIFAYGLRNPFRIEFDRLTGDLWIGEVGQSNVEEVNKISAAEIASPTGLNFGWPTKEGSFLFPPNEGDPKDFTAGLVNPALEYDHEDGSTIIGGPRIRNGQPELEGLYVFGDHRGIRDTTEPTPPPHNVARLFYGDTSTGQIFEFNVNSSLGSALPERIFSVAQASDGSLYLSGSTASFSGAALYKVSIAGNFDPFGDLDNDGDVDADDFYGRFVPYYGTDLTGLSTEDAYRRGDLDFDRDIDLTDFILLNQAYLANHPGGAALQFPVPEPTSAIIVTIAGFAFCAIRRPLRPNSRPA